MISVEQITTLRDDLNDNLEKLESHLARLNEAQEQAKTRIASQRGAIEMANYLLQMAEQGSQQAPAEQPQAAMPEPQPDVQPAPLPVEAHTEAMAKDLVASGMNGKKPR